MGKILTCETCKKEFEKKNQRGRPPKNCYDCQETIAKNKVEHKEAKEKAQDTGLTPIPILKQFESAEEISVGQTVYYVPGWTENPVAKRRFSKTLTVISKNEDGDIVVMSDAKVGFRKYPVPVSYSRLYYKDGVEYLDMGTENDVIMEDEGDND